MLKIAYHPIYKHPLPEGHRFPMEKYDLLPRQLLHEGSCLKEHFFEPQKAKDKEVLRCHTQEYVNALKQLEIDPRAQRKTGFPLSQELVDRELIIAQGTIDGCHYALENGIAMNIAGGTHHAYTNHGEAFLDVHQGNGTAEIFKNDPSVFTFSMHGKANYPFKKELSDLDCSVQGCKERDRFVLQSCYDLNIPVQCSMGGGYSPDIKIIVDAHANTYRLAQEIYF